MNFEIVDNCELMMQEKMEYFHEELNTVRTGMANSNMLNGVMVDYYGSPTPLKQIASISVQEGRTLVVKPYDPTSLKDIERACNMSELGLPVQNDGTVIRMSVPQLTGDDRKELCKKVSKIAEEVKIQIRNVRRDGMNDIKKSEELSEDLQKRAEESMQKLTDKFVAEIEKVANAKKDEVMKV